MNGETEVCVVMIDLMEREESIYTSTRVGRIEGDARGVRSKEEEATMIGEKRRQSFSWW